jgi:hypothetical protein
MEDFFKVMIGVAIGAVIVGAIMSDDAQIGASVEFNEKGQRGYFQFVGEGEGLHRHSGERCRQYDVVYTDDCGRPTGVVETRIECKRGRFGQWETVSEGDFHQTRPRFNGHRPDFVTCNFDQQTDTVNDWPADGMMEDDLLTEDQDIPPAIQLRPRRTIIPAPNVDPAPPAILPMDQTAPDAIPMGNDPQFLFPQSVQ